MAEFERRYFEDPHFPPGLKGGDEVAGYGYYPGYFPIVEAQLASLAEVSGARTLLDAGCGKGALAEYARRALHLKVAGTDRSVYALGHARRRAGGELSCRADVCRLPFRDDGFDLVWSNGVLQYLEAGAAEEALEELTRVARLAAFVSNIAAVERYSDWGKHDSLTRLYLTPGAWEGMARHACQKRGEACRPLALPYEGESAILLLKAMRPSQAARMVELSIERMRRLGAPARRPPRMERFLARCARES